MTVAEIAAVQDRLGRYFDDLQERAARFGDADAIVDALRDASDGGKYVRPELVLRVHAALQGSEHAVAVEVASAFELLHTALVIHDDLIDRDWRRRCKPNVGGSYRSRAREAGVPPEDAAHYGISVGVIAGDLALAGALRLVASVHLGDDRRLHLLHLIDDAIVASAVGEIADIDPNNQSATPSEVARTHRAKTAFYTFEAPLQAGAILAGASLSVIEALGAFGRHVGTAYQILDDIAGALGDEHDTGKAPGTDIRFAKPTSVMATARSGSAWEDLRHLFGKSDLTALELAHARACLIEGGTIAILDDQVTNHLVMATSILDEVPPGLRSALLPLLGSIRYAGPIRRADP